MAQYTSTWLSGRPFDPSRDHRQGSGIPQPSVKDPGTVYHDKDRLAIQEENERHQQLELYPGGAPAGIIPTSPAD
ncbi:hypothetical protein VMCG_01950 [Cytospora schulzeri]|uniref:Uncharacterized protein n=1 Tax=Cytospora schulzeri TaxID=448051 RepID=A0A423X463_9PEZI|nr:hypothetical protein VMCG_01950 [Valsa malicola]